MFFTDLEAKFNLTHGGVAGLSPGSVYIHALGREIALPKNPTAGGWSTFEFVDEYISSIPRKESVFWMLGISRAVQMPTRVVPGPYTCPLKSTL